MDSISGLGSLVGIILELHAVVDPPAPSFPNASGHPLP